MSWLADLEEERRQISDMIADRSIDTTPSVRLGLRTLQRRLEELERALADAASTHLRLQLSGPPVRGHEITVDALAPVLEELQATISSIGQALKGEATAYSSIPAGIREQTALTVEALTPGSVVVHLRTGVDQRAIEPPLFSAAEGGDQPLAVAAITRLVDLANLARDESSDDDAIVDDVFPLGPRTYLHLNKLMKAFMDHDLEVNINVKSPIEGEREAYLNHASAKNIYDVLKRTEVAGETVHHEGELRGMSSLRNSFELALSDGRVLAGKVRENLVPQLINWYEKRVLATFDVTVTRTRTTGAEVRRYLLVGLAEITDGERSGAGQKSTT